MGGACPVLGNIHWYVHNCDLFHPPNFEEKAKKKNCSSSTDLSHYGKSELVVTKEYTLNNIAIYHRERVRTKGSLEPSKHKGLLQILLQHDDRNH